MLSSFSSGTYARAADSGDLRPHFHSSGSAPPSPRLLTRALSSPESHGRWALSSPESHGRWALSSPEPVGLSHPWYPESYFWPYLCHHPCLSPPASASQMQKSRLDRKNVHQFLTAAALRDSRNLSPLLPWPLPSVDPSPTDLTPALRFLPPPLLVSTPGPVSLHHLPSWGHFL